MYYKTELKFKLYAYLHIYFVILVLLCYCVVSGLLEVSLTVFMQLVIHALCNWKLYSPRTRCKILNNTNNVFHVK